MGQNDRGQDARRVKKKILIGLVEDEATREESDEWQAATKRVQGLEFHFRQKYNLCRSDPRYLTATEAEILEDYLEELAYEDLIKGEERKRYERWVNEAQDEDKFKAWQKEAAKTLRQTRRTEQPMEPKPMKKQFRKINIQMGA